MRYALVGPTNLIERLAEDGKGGIDPAVKTRVGWRWLPCPVVTPPSYDPAAQVREGPTFTVGASSVTESYTVRAMTAQELSDAKDRAVEGINGVPFSPLLRVLFNLNNRVRALEGQSALTVAQFRAAIKALL